MRGRPITCCFTGHRPGKLPWGYNEADCRCQALKQKIADAVDSAYQTGYRHFICGMAQGCDFYFAEAVLSLRRARPDVTQEILSACDFETLVQDHYSPGCMQRRNRYMVDHSALIIAVYDGLPGGTRQTLEYAIRQQVDFVDIHPEGTP